MLTLNEYLKALEDGEDVLIWVSQPNLNYQYPYGKEGPLVQACYVSLRDGEYWTDEYHCTVPQDPALSTCPCESHQPFISYKIDRNRAESLLNLKIRANVILQERELA